MYCTECPSMTKYQEAPFVASKYCEYVLYRMYYRYHTERRNSLSAPLRPVLGVMREGLNHLCFPTYYRGPFVASNIANLPLDLRSILAMIVPVVVGPLAGHANSLSPLGNGLWPISKWRKGSR